MVVTRREALVQGWDDHRLRRSVADGQLTRVRRGNYAGADELAALDRVQRHRADVSAALTAQDAAGVVSHQSAAVLWGLPVWGCDLRTVQLTKDRRNAGRRSGLVHVHGTPLEADERGEVGGVAVTSVARTVVDVARRSGFEAGVVLADAALRDGLTTADELAEVVGRVRGRTGATVARGVVAFADGRAESVGESRSRVLMHRTGVPAPELQVTVYREDGTVAGRPDFRWGRLLGEFDGAVKYGRLLRTGETAGDAVMREKRREDGLRELGFAVIRWGWSDLDRPVELATRILAAVSRASASSAARHAPAEAERP